MRFKYLVIFSLFILILSIGVVAATEEADILSANNITVSGNGFNNIQKSIDGAKDNDVIQLDGTYTSSGKEITISKSVTIEGKNCATLNANKKSSVFNIKSKNLTLKNIKFINSKTCAIKSDGCILTIINCTFQNNVADKTYDSHEQLYDFNNDYGAIYVNKGKLAIYNSKFSNNLANYGYAIGMDNSALTIEDSTFYDHKVDYNKMASGGSLISIYASSANIKNSNFKNNGMPVLYLDNKASNIINCNFENNYQAISSNSNLNVINSTFTSNKGNSIQTTWSKKLKVDGCKFNKNANSCVNVYQGTTEILNSEFYQNNANYGAALYLTGKITVDNCKFDSNTAKYGGSIYVVDGWDEKDKYESVLNLINSSITNSKATTNGGAVYVTCCDVNLKGTNITTQSASKGSQIYLEVGKFTSANSKYISMGKIDKIEAQLRYVNPLTTTFDSGKNFFVDVVYKSYTGETYDDGDYLVSMGCTKIMFKVYTGSKYKIYYFNPTYSSSEPKFKIDSSISVGKHKVEILPNGKYFTFKKVTTTITIKKAKTIVKAPKVTAKYKKSKYFKVTVKNKASGKLVPNLKIKIKVYTGKKFRKYIVYTDSNGVAKISTKKIKRGLHKVKITSKNSNYELSKVSYIKIK